MDWGLCLWRLFCDVGVFFSFVVVVCFMFFCFFWFFLAFFPVFFRVVFLVFVLGFVCCCPGFLFLGVVLVRFLLLVGWGWSFGVCGLNVVFLVGVGVWVFLVFCGFCVFVGVVCLVLFLMNMVILVDVACNSDAYHLQPLHTVCDAEA